MFKPVSLYRFIVAIAAVVAFIAAVVTVLDLWDPFKPVFNRLVEHSVTINSILLLILIILAVSVPFLVFNSRLYFARSVLQNAEIRIKALLALLEKSELLRMTDFVTRIPNQEQFFVDLEKISTSVSYASPFQLIFIDLTSFGEVNRKYGYPTGDKIIEYFAQSVLETMRRNESIYKLPFDEDIRSSDLWQRAYRKHTGGDEFLFMIGGNEAEALGFLVRLQRRTIAEFTFHIQSEILNSTDWSLSFSASIIPIFPNDTKDDVIARAHEGMRIARQPGSTCRVVWSSRKTPDDISVEWQKKIYQDAIELFSTGGV